MLLKLKEQINTRYFLGLFLIYVAASSAIIRANYYFNDDLVYATGPGRNVILDGRPVAELVFNFFSLGLDHIFLDATPLSQIITIFLFAVLSMLLLQSQHIKLSWGAIFCLIPVLINPYTVMWLQYKYLVINVSVGFILSVLPFCFKNLKQFPLIAAGCVFLAASNYQTAVGAYICLTIYEFMVALSSRQKLSKILKRTWSYTWPFVLGLGAHVILAKVLVAISSQGSNYGVVHGAFPAIQELPATFLKNTIFFFKACYLSLWRGTTLSWLIFYFFLFFLVVLGLRSWHSSRRARVKYWGLWRLAFILLSVPCLLASIACVQFVLVKPILAGNRSYYGIGIMLSLIMLFLHQYPYNKMCRVIFQGLTFVIVLQFGVFASAQGNLLSMLKQWELTVTTMLAVDMANHIKETGRNVVFFNKSMSYQFSKSPSYMVSTSKYPRLNQVAGYNATVWDYRRFYLYTGIRIAMPGAHDKIEGKKLHLVSENYIYRFERTDDNIAVITYFQEPPGSNDK